jgi:lipid II:glycine glycyltransferase (peptidoglycan interpeptide bridge formation enzyme)
MDLKVITEKQKAQYNKTVTHVMQSWEWGEFRKNLGLPLLRYGLFKNNKLKIAFQLTLHQIPFTKLNVGYLPKGPLPNQDFADALLKIGKQHDCAFIKIEPHILMDTPKYSISPIFSKSLHPMFSKHNFVLDLTPTEEILLKNMHQKTRYNIRIAQKKEVVVDIDDSDTSFKTFLKMHFETAKRQGFLSHNEKYFETLWKNMKPQGNIKIAIGKYNKKPLTCWLLFVFKDTIYYAYGASSTEHKDVMSNNLVAWETIKYGKKLGLKQFDMWGALGPNPDPKDPWIGFHRFKAGYGAELVEYIGTFDIIFNHLIYYLFNFFDRNAKLKAQILKFIGR